MAKDILIVDDEADIRDLISDILTDEEYETRLAANSDQALGEIAARVPSLVILDIWLQGSALDGMEILQQIRQQHDELPVVMISGHGTISNAVDAIKLGAYDYIEKPFKTDRLLHVVQRAFEASRLQRENRELRQRAGPETEIIGDSTLAQGVAAAISKVATTGSRVLITGPAGSGKEVVARSLHAKSTRGDGPFVVLNAAMMAPERMEAELFGVEADGSRECQRVGVFEQAHGGTLLLDEVADMPIETQNKILRVLVDQKFMRVGGTMPVEVDVRVISSSSRDLNERIQAGEFREDLFHRLNVVPIKVPALRDRPEDIMAMVEYFTERSAQALGRPARELSEDAMAALQSHDWPGNVRQLRNVIERLLILAPGEAADKITVDMLPAEISAPTPSPMREEGAQEVMTLPLRDAREVFEREYLMAQIGRFGGNISRTAEFIGMERSALHRKLKSLGVSPRTMANGAG
jgi:two-component system nitrogen regulation response regulator NtrX